MKRRIRRLNDDLQGSHQISGICGTSNVQPMKRQRIGDFGRNAWPRSTKQLSSPSNDKVLHQVFMKPQSHKSLQTRPLQPLYQLPSQPLHLTQNTQSSLSRQLPLHLPPQLLPHVPPQPTPQLPRQLPLLTKPLHQNQPFSISPYIIRTRVLSHKLSPPPPRQLNFLSPKNSDQPPPPPPSVTHVPGPPAVPPPPPVASDPYVPPPPPETSPDDNGSVPPVFFGNVKEPGSEQFLVPVRTTSFYQRETPITRNPHLSPPVFHRVELSSSRAPDSFHFSQPHRKVFANRTTSSAFYGVPTSSPSHVTKRPKLYHHRLSATSNFVEIDSIKAPQGVVASSSCASDSRTWPMGTPSLIQFSNPVICNEPLGNPQHLQVDPSHLLDGSPVGYDRGIEKIGEDCVGLIIGFLSHRDVCRVKAVRSFFARICCKICKSVRSISCHAKVNEIPKRHFVNVVISDFVNIREFAVYQPMTLSFSEIKTVVEQCPLLENLILRFKAECGLRPGCKPGKLTCQDFLLTYLAEKKPRLKLLVLHACVDTRDIQTFAKSCPPLRVLQLFLGSGKMFHAEPDVMLNVVAELVTNTKPDYVTLYMSGVARYFMERYFMGSNFWKHLPRLHLIDYRWRELFLDEQYWRTPAMKIFKLTTKNGIIKKKMKYICCAENNFKITLTDKNKRDQW